MKASNPLKNIIQLIQNQIIVIFCISFFIGLKGVAQNNSNHQPPNIIVLLADDMRYDCLGVMGNPVIKTPNLDNLGNQGVIFDNSYCTTAICQASRAQIMSGKYEFSNGVNFMHGNMPFNDFMDTYPMALKKEGYHVGFAGKYGFYVSPENAKDNSFMKTSEATDVVAREYDWWCGWVRGHQGKYNMIENKEAYAFQEKYKNKQPVNEHCEVALGEMSQDYIKLANETGKPFCLSVYFKAPHGPLSPDKNFDQLYDGIEMPKDENFGKEWGEHLPKHAKSGRQESMGTDWIRKFEDKESKYYRLIYGIDQAVGMITKQLEQLGIADNTVIIFTSDNGWSGGRKGLSGKVLPYEDASRAPMIIYDPRHKTANKKTRINELTANIDIAPTVLDLAGIEKPNYMQGESMMKLLEDPEKSIHESLLLINVWGVPSHQSISVVNKKYKYINWFYGGQNYQQTQEVYDMNKDPLERKNQIDNHELKDDIEKMGILYDNWLTRWKNEAVHREDYLRYPNLGDRELNWSQKNKKHTSLLEEMQLKMTDENGVYSKHKKKANNMDDKSKIQ